MRREEVRRTTDAHTRKQAGEHANKREDKGRRGTGGDGIETGESSPASAVGDVCAGVRTNVRFPHSLEATVKVLGFEIEEIYITNDKLFEKYGIHDFGEI